MKKTLALLLALTMVLLAFAGCSSDTASTTTDTSSDAAATTDGSNASASGQVVKIGFLSPITGPNAAEGAAARNAFMLAIEQANASGEYP